MVLKKVSFSRGGLKLGLDYDLDVETQSQSGLPETGVLVNSLNAIQPFSDISSMSSQPLLLPYGVKDKQVFGDAVQQFAEVDSGDRNFAIGLALDRISQQGINFRGQAYATRIQSSSDGKSPMSAYTYYLSKNTLQYSPQGVMVQS